MENEHDTWNKEDDVVKQDSFTKGLKVEIDEKSWDTLFGWCRAATSEVSGMGLIKKDGSTFSIYDVFLPKQTCHHSGTTLTEEGKALLQGELHKKKIPGSNLRLWWHTHYNFGTFFSTTDVQTIEELCGNNKDWILSMVINQAGDYKCRLDIMNPIRIAIENISVVKKINIDDSLADKYKKDIETNVSEEKWGGYKLKNLGFPGFKPSSDDRWFRKWEKKQKKGLPKENNHSKYVVHDGRVMTQQEYEEEAVRGFYD